MGLRSGALCAAFVLGLAGHAAAQEVPAASQEASSREAARERGGYERFGGGVDLYREGNFAAALTEFEAAYAASPTYKVLYNIGQVRYQLQDYVEALRAFELFLAKGGEAVAPARRAEVEQVLETLRTRVSKLEIAANVDGAEVALDDRAIGVSPLAAALLVNVGRHKVTLTKRGYAELTRFVDVAGNKVERLPLEMVPLAPAPARAPEADAPSQASSSRMTPLSWIGVGVAAAFAIGATATGIAAVNAKASLDDKPPSDPTTQDARSHVRSFALATDLLAGAAIVTLGTTLAITFLSPQKARTGFTGVRIGAGIATAQWSF